MIKLFYSASPDLAKRAARREIKKDYPNLDESNFVSFNMATSMLKDLAQECSFLSLGSEKKCVLAYDCAFLGKSKTKPKFAKEDNPSALLDYLNNPIYETDLYLLVYNEGLDSKSDFVKAITKNGFIKEVLIPAPGEWVEYVGKYYESRNMKIQREAAIELVRRDNADFGVFLNDLAKLEAYANGETITLDAVKRLVTPLEEENVFALSNALTKGDNGAALEAYQKAKVFGMDEIRMINMLYNQFAFLDQVRFLDARGFSSQGIAKELATSPKRVEVALYNLYKIRGDKLEKTIEQLYELEKDILHGDLDPVYGFTLFLTKAELN